MAVMGELEPEQYEVTTSESTTKLHGGPALAKEESEKMDEYIIAAAPQVPRFSEHTDRRIVHFGYIVHKYVS